jgi:hypothetical protein
LFAAVATTTAHAPRAVSDVHCWSDQVLAETLHGICQQELGHSNSTFAVSMTADGGDGATVTYVSGHQVVRTQTPSHFLARSSRNAEVSVSGVNQCQGATQKLTVSQLLQQECLGRSAFSSVTTTPAPCQCHPQAQPAMRMFPCPSFLLQPSECFDPSSGFCLPFVHEHFNSRREITFLYRNREQELRQNTQKQIVTCDVTVC